MAALARLGRSGAGGGGLDLEQRVFVPLGLERRATTPYAEQPLAPDQVDDQTEVDDERADLEERDLLRQLVDLQRQKDAGADGGDVLAPSLQAPQADPLGDLQQAVADEERLDEMQRAAGGMQ